MSQYFHKSDDIPNSVSLSNSTQHIYQSSIVGKRYKLFIARPNQEVDQISYPVLYLLDANNIFMMATEMIRLLQWTNELPPMFIVGIGYDDEDLLAITNRRIQEFTPTVDDNYKKIWSSQAILKSDGGEAALFLQFICEELKPYIESLYPVNPDDAILAGDSLGGLFALYSLFHTPHVFQRYIIGSPIIFWDEGILWKYEEQYAVSYKNLNSQVFFGVGAQEDSKPYHFPEDSRDQMSHVSMVDDMRKMVDKLKSRNYSDLDLHSHIFEGETHMSVIAPWLNRGLRTLLKGDMDHKFVL